MRAMACHLWLVLALSLGVSAQKAGQHHGLFLSFGGWGSPAVSAVGQIDPLNRVKTYPTTTSGPWPYWGNLFTATQDVDNRHVILPALVGRFSPQIPDQYALAVWDTRNKSVISTLWSNPYNLGMPRNITNTCMNSDGDLVGYDSLLDLVVVYDRRNGTWSGATVNTPAPNGGLGGFEWDRLNGGYFHASGMSRTEQVLLKTSWDLKNTTVMASGVLNFQACYGGTMLEDGMWVSSSATGGTYMVVKPSTERWEHGPLSVLGAFTDVTSEKYAAPGRGYYAAFSGSHSPVNRGIAYMDAATTPHTATFLVGGPWPNAISGPVMEVMPLHHRDLTTERTGKAAWNVILNPEMPHLSGHPYAIAASLKGATPPIQLPDGRQIFLVPDTLTLLAIQGSVPPFLKRNTGFLNAQGKATASLELTSLGTTANGITIHFCAVVFDPMAPTGIGWVCDPWALVVNVLL